MFFSSNWGDKSIKITDDINSLADGATATPRDIIGSNVPLQDPDIGSIAVDRSRHLIYVSDFDTGEIYVWNNAKTVTGNIAPDRTIHIATQSSTVMFGVAIDSARNRLYVSGYTGSVRCVFILNHASTKNGTVTADVVLPATSSEALFIDHKNDRLYVTNNSLPGVDVYDNASTLTNSSTPNRIITISQALILPYTIWVDAHTDKLYYGSRNASTGGYNLFIFDNASALSGTKDPDTDSTARIALGSLINAMVDNHDHLYMWSDSATSVVIYNNASTLSGPVSTPPDKTINSVVHFGYGMDYLSY